MKKLIERGNIKVTMLIVIVLTVIDSVITSTAIPMLSGLPSKLNHADMLKRCIIQLLVLYIAGAVIGAILGAFERLLSYLIINNTSAEYLTKEFSCKLKILFGNDSGELREYITKLSALNSDIVMFGLSLLNMSIIFGNMLLKMGMKVGVHAPIICLIIMSVEGCLFWTACKKISMSEVHKSTSRLLALRQDLMSNIRTLRYLNKRDYAISELVAAQNATSATDISIRSKRKLAMNMIAVLSIAPILICVWLLRGSANIELATFVVMSEWCVSRSIDLVLDLIDKVSDRRDIKKRLSELNSDNESIPEPIPSSGIRLENVVFGYPEDGKVFEIPELQIVKNERYSLTGESGQGKSSLANLLIGAIEPISGTVHRHKVFYVYQETEALNKSIRENILLGESMGDDEIIKLLDKVGLPITNFTDGLDTVIGERGYRLSSGEKQRLNIVRAIVAMRTIDSDTLIVLDEPTSNLDTKTEKLVVELIDSVCKNTLLVITHRPAIENICNHHIVVENHVFREV